MGSFDVIIDGIRFSYSSTNTYETCAHAFKLGYLGGTVAKLDNFYSDFGTLVHECFEAFFKKEVGEFELSKFYKDRFPKAMKCPPPAFPTGMKEKYKEQGQKFFDNFAFPLHLYEVLLVEGKMDFRLNGNMFTARPDLVLKEKATGKIILYDYKTATPFKTDKKTGKEVADKKKIDGYYDQMHLYTYAIKVIMGIQVEQINLWFPRLDKMVELPWKQEKEDQVLQKVSDTVTKIRADESFTANNTNAYFCNYLCGVRQLCKFRK